ncbi:hypothetical protein [Chryseobacterium lathyri]|uniref:Uncharacterized protein n=1 Tax=Chryseobacterium lathyri TaxID=395933 RepID=A0A511YG17_9FLAO|nr:hypothetical protein [Chryseobacterium lathyri]GEN74106.1 hypothetical protein CLA01_41780 [Chryseobacterium lathyri]
MLKWSSEKDVNEFCAEICSRFNPKYVGNQQEKDALAELDFATAYSFAKNCELTAEEFFLAFNLAAEGRLKYEEDKDGNAEPIKLFREIDAIKLNEVKSAYIRYKSLDKKYENGKAEIKAFLEPPIVEPTPEEKKAARNKFYTAEYRRLQLEGNVLGTIVFYDLIKKRGLKTVKVEFIEAVLSTFIPEKIENIARKEEPEKIRVPKIQKNDPLTYFKDCIVKAYIEKEELKEFTEEAWIEHWEKLHNQE